jgi:hypothetical protein
MIFEPERVSAAAIEPGAAVLVEEAAGAILLDLRRDCERCEVRRGPVEFGEPAEPAARRETRKAAAFEVRLTDWPGVYTEVLW